MEVYSVLITFGFIVLFFWVLVESHFRKESNHIAGERLEEIEDLKRKIAESKTLTVVFKDGSTREVKGADSVVFDRDGFTVLYDYDGNFIESFDKNTVDRTY